jgi:hypothetical protein
LFDTAIQGKNTDALIRVAQAASFDVEAWRRALRGLDLVCWGVGAAAVGLVFAIGLVLPIVLVLSALRFERSASWILILFLFHCVVCAGMLLTGAGLCCLAPNDFGAKRHAQAALVLGVTAAIFTAAVIAMELVIFPNVSQQWFIELTRFEFLYPILGIMLFLNIHLAVASWHHFLKSAAHTFGQPQIAAGLKKFLSCFYMWSGFITLALSLSLVFDVLPGVLVFIGLPTFIGGLPFSAWSISMLLDVRNIVRRALGGPASGIGSNDAQSPPFAE